MKYLWWMFNVRITSIKLYPIYNKKNSSSNGEYCIFHVRYRQSVYVIIRPYQQKFFCIRLYNIILYTIWYYTIYIYTYDTIFIQRRYTKIEFYLFFNLLMIPTFQTPLFPLLFHLKSNLQQLMWVQRVYPITF